MVKNWFEIKTRSLQQDANGKEKMVTNHWLLDAYNYTEAETRMTFLLDGMGHKPYEIKQIKIVNFAEVLRYDAEKWWKAKVAFISFNEQSGSEKAANHYYLISGMDLKEADTNIRDFLKDSISAYEVKSLVETKINDIFPIAEQDPDAYRLWNQARSHKHPATQ